MFNKKIMKSNSKPCTRDLKKILSDTFELQRNNKYNLDFDRRTVKTQLTFVLRAMFLFSDNSFQKE